MPELHPPSRDVTNTENHGVRVYRLNHRYSNRVRFLATSFYMREYVNIVNGLDAEHMHTRNTQCDTEQPTYRQKLSNLTRGGYILGRGLLSCFTQFAPRLKSYTHFKRPPKPSCRRFSVKFPLCVI